LVARASLDLPGYLGSTLRGAFGHVFRAMACPGRFDEPCPIPQSCPYHLIFETSPPPGSEALRTHEEIPRPFVIAPIADGRWMEQGRRLLAPGEEVSFHLTLIGRAQEFFPYFVVALREIDRLGRRPGRLAPPAKSLPRDSFGQGAGAGISSRDCPGPPRAVELRRIDLLDPLSAASWPVYDARENLVRPIRKPLTLADCASVPPPSSDRVTIRFLTQTRLKHDGAYARVPEFHILFRRLLGRLSSLSRFHCGAPLEVDFKGLIDAATEVRLIQNEARWTRWQRYSSRQDRRMDWEGIIGSAAYDLAVIPTEGPSVRTGAEGSTRSDLSGINSLACGENAPARAPGRAVPVLWKFLKFGEYVHVGHGATFGLGKYEIGG
jgi:hypothetical protein